MVDTDKDIQATDEEKAFANLVAWLRQRLTTRPEGDGRSVEPYGFDIYRDIIAQKLNTQGLDPNSTEVVKAKLPLLNAIWDMCIRGILRPSAMNFNASHSLSVGSYFTLTSYGLEWLRKPTLSEAIPMEYGRFAQLLARYNDRFGDAYRFRAQEAVNCYEAHTYFAACAMCGAAAESVLLALAFAKMGEEKALNEYQRSGGRHKIRNALVGQANNELQIRFDNYIGLMNYWRDESAHGVARSMGEEEAFTSLLLLLRFAQLGTHEWDDLTKSS